MDEQKNKVLVVEGFYATRNTLIYILRHNGFKAIESVSGCREALGKLDSGEYGMVLSDWNNKIDGLDLLNTIRGISDLKDIIFIMVTFESDRDKVMMAKESGVDGYVRKPFTAEALCKRIVSALKVKYKDIYKEAQRSAQEKRAQSKTGSTQTGIRVLGSASKTSAVPAKSWSIAPYYLSSKPKGVVIRSNIAAMIEILSPQFDMMKERRDFVGVDEMLVHVATTVMTAEKQTEAATQIAVATQDIAQALNLLDAPGGSPESVQGLKMVNESATKLSGMINQFDKDAEDVMKMLQAMEAMVRQAHIREINESIKASCECEMHPGCDMAIDSKDESNAKEVADNLSRIKSESENSRDMLTTAADGIARVIEKLNATDPSASASRERFHVLSGRIEDIMDMLDGQIAKSETLAQGMSDVTTVRSEVADVTMDRGEDAGESRIAKKESNPVDKSQNSEEVPPAFKRIIEYRILMIDLIKKDHDLSIKNLQEILDDKTKVRHEHLPGFPAGSLSKWVDKRLEQKDFYDINICHQIADIKDEMYEEAEKVIAIYEAGGKVLLGKRWEVSMIRHLPLIHY